MSCYCRQTIQVSTSEWAIASSARDELARLGSTIPGRLADLRAQARRDLEQSVAELGARASASERALAGLTGAAADLNRSIDRRLAGIDRDVAAGIGEQRALGVELKDLIAAAGARLNAAVTAERRAREVQLAALRADYRSLADARSFAAGTARDVLAGARATATLIADALPHERFAPGRLARLNARLDDAVASANSGFGEAATAEGQAVLAELVELRLEVELADRDHRLLRVTASEALGLVELATEDVRTVPAVDTDGKPIDVTVDVPYWSAGAYDELIADLAEARREIDEASPERLREIVTVVAPELETRSVQVATNARSAQAQSQLRVNVADVAAGVLADQGFELEGGVWAGGDDRNAFHAWLVHPDSTEVVLVVEPNADGTGSPALRLESFDSADTAAAEEIRKQRGLDLASALRDAGLGAGVPSRDQGKPDPALRDLDRVERTAPVRRRG
ncbi:hypothetical protein [Cryptosporangium sp. NPDC051539]|uniref:hypothetical protein n=1 Tax=Cryptosporangium sp. NPDC051539 TaxID=3363962 RepID=UPI0037AD06EA